MPSQIILNEENIVDNQNKQFDAVSWEVTSNEDGAVVLVLSTGRHVMKLRLSPVAAQEISCDLFDMSEQLSRDIDGISICPNCGALHKW